jgi:hypothetical protein
MHEDDKEDHACALSVVPFAHLHCTLHFHSAPALVVVSYFSQSAKGVTAEQRKELKKPPKRPRKMPPKRPRKLPPKRPKK